MPLSIVVVIVYGFHINDKKIENHIMFRSTFSDCAEREIGNANLKFWGWKFESGKKRYRHEHRIFFELDESPWTHRAQNVQI